MGKVFGAGPDPLRQRSKHSAPTVLCRALRGVPGHASCLLAVLVFSSVVLARNHRAHGTVAPWAEGGGAVVPQTELIKRSLRQDDEPTSWCLEPLHTYGCCAPEWGDSYRAQRGRAYR